MCMSKAASSQLGPSEALQRCPKCGALNQPSAAVCSACRTALVEICPRCQTPRKWYITECAVCAHQSDINAQEFTRLYSPAPTKLLKERFRILETLASSNISSVYRAERLDTASSQLVRITELRTTAHFRAAEKRALETSVVASVNRWRQVEHPSLLPIDELIVETERYYVISPYVAGISWHTLARDNHWRPPVGLILLWLEQLCLLLHALEPHRPDLNLAFVAPQHLMSTTSGLAMLIDHGLTSLVAPTEFGPYGSITGYAAPELARSQPTLQSDIYTLGRCIAALLTHRSLENTSGTPPISLPGLDKAAQSAIKQVLTAMLAQDPAKRADSVQVLLERVQKAHARVPNLDESDWIAHSLRPVVSDSRPVPRSRSAMSRRAASADSMEALGFTPDPRYGIQASERVAPPAPPPARTSAPSPAATNPPRAAALTVTPKEIRYEPDPGNPKRRVVLTLHNRGSSPIEGRLRPALPWLSAPGKLFVIPGGKSARAIVTIDADLVPAGDNLLPQALAIETNAGSRWISFRSLVRGTPSLHLASTQLDFGTLTSNEPRQLMLSIENHGTLLLSGAASARVPWVQVPGSKFNCPQGTSRDIPIKLLPSMLPNGPQTTPAAIALDTNGGQALVAVSAWRQRPALVLEPTVLDFGALPPDEAVERSLKLVNRGDGPAHGQVISNHPSLWLSTDSFSLEAGATVSLRAVLTAKDLPAGRQELSGALQVLHSDGTVLALDVRATVMAPLLVFETAGFVFGSVALGKLTTAQLLISNEGNAPFAGILEVHPPWLQVGPNDLRLEPGTTLTLSATADSNQLGSEADYDSENAVSILSLDTGASVAEIAAHIAVIQPLMELSASSINFGYIPRGESAQQELVISNSGSSLLAWQAQSTADWLEISPTQGTCRPGTAQAVVLRAYSLAFDADEREVESILTINSDGGRAKLTVHAGIAAPVLAVEPAILALESINAHAVNGSLRIFNRGLGELSGTLSSSDSWLVPERLSFVCATGRSVGITIVCDLEELPINTSSLSGEVRIASNGGEGVVEVQLAIVALPELVAPERLIFVPDGPAWTAKVALQNIGRALLSADLATTHQALQCDRSRVDIKPGKSVRLKLHWNSSQFPGPGEAGLVITHDTNVETITS